MEYMAALGYMTVIHDHRGHGQSVKSGDDLGDMYAEVQMPCLRISEQSIKI